MNRDGGWNRLLPGAWGRAIAAGALAALAGTALRAEGDSAAAKRAWLVEPRERIVTERGAFVLFDAPRSEDASGLAGTYLAYWNDFSSGEIFVFSRLIQKRADVAEAMRRLRREFGVEPEEIAGTSNMPMDGTDQEHNGESRNANGEDRSSRDQDDGVDESGPLPDGRGSEKRPAVLPGKGDGERIGK